MHLLMLCACQYPTEDQRHNSTWDQLPGTLTNYIYGMRICLARRSGHSLPPSRNFPRCAELCTAGEMQRFGLEKYHSI